MAARIFVLAAILLACVPAFAVDTSTVEIKGSTISRVDAESGESLWRIRHASERSILGVVELNNATYYAIDLWLFRADMERGVILERIPMPAMIQSLELDGEALKLVVKSEYGDPAVIRYRPGQL